MSTEASAVMATLAGRLCDARFRDFKCLGLFLLILFLFSLQRTYTLIVDAMDWDNGTRGGRWKDALITRHHFILL